MSAKTTAQILAEAAEIVRRGWCQGQLRTFRCAEHCVFGAVEHVTGHKRPGPAEEMQPALDLATAVAHKLCGLPDCLSLVYFNDEIAESHQDVAALLDLSALAAAHPEILDV